MSELSKFSTWLFNEGVEITKIEFAFKNNFNRFVRAKREISKGDTLLTVPLKTLILLSTVLSSPIGQKYNLIKVNIQ